MVDGGLTAKLHTPKAIEIEVPPADVQLTTDPDGVQGLGLVHRFHGSRLG